MKVIDISDWQEGIDLDEAYEDGMRGLIVKISEGCSLQDLYSTHIAKAKELGIPWGVYCLTHAPHEDRAAQEAQTVIDELYELGEPELGIWYDVEPEHADSLDSDILTACCSAFVVRCNENGYSAGIYGTYYTLSNQVQCYDLADYVPYWVADPSNQNDFAIENPSLRVVGWQYALDKPAYGVSAVDFNEWEY